jgi:hypothetical protein
MASVRPADAFWNKGLKQFNLPYDAVRMGDDPDQTLMEFLVSTYEAAATLGHWDRVALECPFSVCWRHRQTGPGTVPEAWGAWDAKTRELLRKY